MEERLNEIGVESKTMHKKLLIFSILVRHCFPLRNLSLLGPRPCTRYRPLLLTPAPQLPNWYPFHRPLFPRRQGRFSRRVEVPHLRHRCLMGRIFPRCGSRCQSTPPSLWVSILPLRRTRGLRLLVLLRTHFGSPAPLLKPRTRSSCAVVASNGVLPHTKSALR